MKKRILAVMLALAVSFSFAACGKTESKEAEKTEQKDETVSSEQEETEEEVTEEVAQEENSASFSQFVGNYSFMSGAGAWSTDVNIYEDGTFTGEYHDSDMGDIGDDYPNGVVYVCKFSGKFSELTKVDDYTYACSIESLTEETPTGTEEIGAEDGIKYIYAGPYGFDNADKFEFYLPGKNVADLNPDFLSWMSLRYNQPYPDRLFNRAFNNMSENEGFEEYSSYVEDTNAEYPASLELDAFSLAGKYHSDNLNIDMIISAFTDYVEGDQSCGNITWEIPDDVFLYNDDATFLPSDNGFDVTPGFYGEYKIIVTDNTPGKVVIHLYDSKGFDCGEYVMTEHFES